MTELNANENMLASLDRVMRLLRRGHSNNSHGGRSVYRMLAIIQRHEGISTRELAERLDMRPSSLNEKLVDLEHEQLIRRMRNEHDQRIFMIQLQAKGLEQLEAIKQERFAFNTKVAGILSEAEAMELSKLATKLSDGLEEMMQVEPKGQRHGHWR